MPPQHRRRHRRQTALRKAVDDLDVDRCPLGRLLYQFAKTVLGLHREHFGRRRRIVGKVHAVARTDLDDTPFEPTKQPMPLLASPALLEARAQTHPQTREQRMMHLIGHDASCPWISQWGGFVRWPTDPRRLSE